MEIPKQSFRECGLLMIRSKVEVAPLDALNDGVLFRQRMNELYELCPGYSF